MGTHDSSSTDTAAKTRPPRPKLTAADRSASSHGTVIVREGIEWYRASSKRLFTVVLAQSGVILILGVLAGFLILNRPSPVYFAATNDMRIVKLAPLNEPYISNNGLLNWSVGAITSTLSFDFLNYTTQLEGVRDKYTPDAFKQVIGAIQASGIMSKVRSERLSLSASPTAAPIIEGTGIVNGQFAWKVQFPIVMSYQSSTGVVGVQKAMVTMVVMRQNTIQYPSGVAITQVLIK